jgi:CRP-like cAMP-binding protein
MRRDLSSGTDGNRLLHALSRRRPRRFVETMRRVSLKVEQVLYEAGARIEYVYFPVDCVLSAVSVMQDGTMIEVATVGNEGGVGLPPVLQPGISPNRVFAQIAGDAVRIDAALLKAEADRDPELNDLLVRYGLAFFAQVSRSVACNGLHNLEQRCCRWLLMTHDRLPADEVPLTHEFLGIMLGVRRAGVTEALKSLKAEGLIDYRRGIIRIKNRPGLEARSCECYQAVIEEYKRLLDHS